MRSSKEEFGALGSWQKIDERFDETIIKQDNDTSCVSAVGEMLAKFYGLNISQQEILENIGEWSNAEYLANYLNYKESERSVKWIGGSWGNSVESIRWLTQTYRVWGVMLREGKPEGHAVLIDGEDENGLIIIKDPFDQTKYN